MNQERIQQPVAEYVVGYCFREGFDRVALIEKLKPAWQAGKLNGIGGKVEPGESIAEAMAREFEEEAGVRIDEWLHIRTEQFGVEQEAQRAQPVGARVHHFACCIPAAAFARISTMEKERVRKVTYPIPTPYPPIIYNIPYLVLMAATLLQQPPENRPLP